MNRQPAADTRIRWDEIAYIQMGTTAGQSQQTGGRINIVNALQHVHDKRARGFVGLEHPTSRPGCPGDLVSLAAYRSVDQK